jgi:hypothetical protein
MLGYLIRQVNIFSRNDPVRNSSSENDFDYNYDLYYNASTNYSSFQTYTEINIYYVREKQHSELRMLDFSECQYLIPEAVVTIIHQSS